MPPTPTENLLTPVFRGKVSKNMEDSWELVAVPAEIEHSTVGKDTTPECTETSLEKNEGNSKSKVRN